MLRILFSLGIATLLSISAVAQQHLPKEVLQKEVPKAYQAFASQSDLKDIYDKWLTEIVVYIITVEEERYFRELKSDEERERFIEEFWLRRDPTPDTDKNEFREEHFERIAYANQNFAVDGIAGWRTDRGRIYITYGKPDEIQQTGSGEIWLVKRRTGLFDRGPGAVEILKFEFRNNSLVR
jgi:GWxTD domain-containing protein